MSREIVGWIAYYADSSRYYSDETLWRALPDDGLQIVMLYQRDGNRAQLSGYDRYFKAGNLYAGNNDPPDDIKRRYEIADEDIKRGKWVTGVELEAIGHMALEERCHERFGVKDIEVKEGCC